MRAGRRRKIETLCRMARERSGAERAVFLARACGSDAELRREIERHLGAADPATPIAAAASALAVATPAAVPAPQAAPARSCSRGGQTTQTDDDNDGGPARWGAAEPGSRLGPYRIEAPLGSGGMGAVFRATDPRLARPVAIKVIKRTGGAAPATLECLFREARAASSLNHRNVVTIFDVGVEEDTTYIVMELVEGHTLERSLRAGPMPVARLLRLALEIGDGLANAHASGIVHRDLKPANIMVTPGDEIRLLDFGLAKTELMSQGVVPIADDDADGPKTRHRAAGTRGYMAPEQARGATVDFRSDQFSFGAILYEMATGRRAFADTPAPPEPVTRLRPEVPMPLQWVIERCLADDPRRRYATTRELCADLTAIAERLERTAPDAAATPHNLPAPRTPIFGRDAEISNAMQLIVKGEARLVTLTGAGGIGKTRLLIALARALLADFPGGVHFVPLDRINAPELVGSSIAAALGLHDARERSTARVLEEWTRRAAERTLLLLDNFEHVLPAAPLLDRLLSAGERLTIVVTSRAAVRLYGEYELVVPPLHVPDPAAPESTLAECPAVRLFLDRAPALRAGAALGRKELATIARICACLDGLPLAIELAAARSRLLPLAGLLERMRDPLQQLRTGASDTPPRHRTLRATIDWSHQLLNEPQRKLFRRLAVFVGGVTLEAMEAVCNVDQDLGADIIDVVEGLVDNSMLQTMEGAAPEPRFTMLETMREYASSRLAQAGEEDRVRRAHAAYCRVLADELTYAGTETAREALYDGYEQELGNLRAALDWLAAAGEADWGLRLAYGLGPYWHERGRAAEGYERHVRLLALDGAPRDVRAWASASAGDLAKHCGLRAEARRHHHECLALGRELGDVALVLRALNALSVMTQHDGDLELSKTHHEEAIAIARSAEAPPSMLAGLMSNYAGLALDRGEHDLAQRLQQGIMRLCRAAADESGAAWCLNHQGDIALARGDPARARRMYEESLAQFTALDQRLGMAGCLYDLARIAAADGEHEKAEAWLSEALSHYAELNHKADVPRMLDALGEIALATGDPRRTLVLSGGAAALRAALRLDVAATAQAQLAPLLERARAALSTAGATTSWMTGWHMPEAELIAFALRRG